MNKICYIITDSLDKHSGLEKKFKAQYAALSNIFPTRVFFRKYYSNKIKKYIVNPVLYQFIYIFYLLFSEKCYIFYRYNFNALFLNFYLTRARHCLILEMNSNNVVEAKEIGNAYRRACNNFFEPGLVKKADRVVSYAYPISKNVEGMAKNKLQVILNGFSGKEIVPEPLPDILKEKIAGLKGKTKFLSVFVGNYAENHGIDRILKLLNSRNDISLVIAGPNFEDIFKKHYCERVILAGFLNPVYLASIYKLCDFAFGSFAFDRGGLEYASPLKASECLYFGKPIVINFKMVGLENCPFIHNYTNENAFNEWLGEIKNFPPSEIIDFANKTFNWNNILEDVFSRLK